MTAAPLALLAPLLMLGSAGWLSYLAARRLLPEAPAWWRGAAACGIGMALSHALFQVLTALHAFRLVVALPLWCAAAGAAHRWLDGRVAIGDLRADARAAGRVARQVVGTPARAILMLALAIVAGVRTGMGLVMPPLAWDALLYHAFKPARWVHHAYQFRQAAPDQWGYLEHFPEGAHVPAAWAMLATGNDALFAPTTTLTWAACALVGYALARALGGRRLPSACAALAIAFLPAAVGEIASGYGDLFALLAFLVAALALVRLHDAPDAGAGVLLGAGLGLLAAAKSSGLVMAAVAYGLAAALALGRPSGARAPAVRAVAVAVVVGLVLGVPGYLRELVETGSPLYPLTVEVGGRVLLRGNEELRQLFSVVGGRPYDPEAATWRSFVQVLLVPRRGDMHEHLGFGPGFVLLAAQGLAGLGFFLQRRARRSPVLALVLLALIPVAGLMSDGFTMQRVVWLQVLGRLILPLPAVLAALAARLDGRGPRACWMTLLAIDAVVGYPLGLAPEVRDALWALAPSLLAALAAAALAAIGARAWRRGLAAPAAALVVFTLVLAAPWWSVRRAYRYRIYAAAARADAPAFIMHSLAPRYAAAWPLWQRLDDGPPHRIALAVGWDGIGHNGYRSPLTGSRFQNEVLYVPITADGAIVDYRLDREARRLADEAAWLRRLREQSIDAVVTLGPEPIERAWIAAHPTLFEPIASSADGYNRAYRVHLDGR